VAYPGIFFGGEGGGYARNFFRGVTLGIFFRGVTPGIFSRGLSQEFFRGGSTNSFANREQRERGSGGVNPLVRGSTQFANE
jgi:hypothetical protein